MKSNHNKIEEKFKSKFHSIRVKLSLTLIVTVTVIVLFLIVINSIVLKAYYIYSKESMLIAAYKVINAYYNEPFNGRNIELELEKMSISNDYDILIKTDTSIYASNKDFLSSLPNEEYDRKSIINRKDLLYSSNKMEVRKVEDRETQLSFLLLSSELDNGYSLYIRTAIDPIQKNVSISNRALMLIGLFTIFIGGIFVRIISKKFTLPIEELNTVTSKITELDFSYKFDTNRTEDEFTDLRKKYKYHVRYTRENNKSA